MNQNPDKIISASRRTDIPAFYIKWFLKQIDQGFFETTNPYNRVKRKVLASVRDIHSIVFWSKNFDPFIKAKAGDILKAKGYNLYFNFTINSESHVLEPQIPDLETRLKQLETLCSLFGPDKILWRFDPICFYKTFEGSYENNLDQFEKIADAVGKMKITRCVTSFTDMYSKFNQRFKYLQKKGRHVPKLIDPEMKKKTDVITRMENLLKQKNIFLSLCCEKELFKLLGDQTTVTQNSCINGHLLKNIYKGEPVTKKDYGQRKDLGCQCTQSIDIGSYDEHPCFHNCLFCYANPAIDQQLIRRTKLNP